MQLATFLAAADLTAAAFARRIGVGRATVCRWLNGTRLPTDPDVLALIFAATEGRVTANDFFGLSGVTAAEPPRDPPPPVYPPIPMPKVEAMLALAQAGVGPDGIRRVAREELAIGMPEFEIWLRLNRLSLLSAAAFFNRGA